MRLVGSARPELTSATAGVIEVPDRDRWSYTVTTGDATSLPRQSGSTRQQPFRLGPDLDQVLHCNDTEVDPRIDRTASRRVKARSMIAVAASARRRGRRVASSLPSRSRRLPPGGRRDAQLLTSRFAAQMRMPPCSGERRRAGRMALPAC